MKRLNRFVDRLRLGSLYVRWILLFMFLIATAHGITLLYTTFQVMPYFIESFKEQLEEKAVFVQALGEAGFEIQEDTLKSTGEVFLEMIFIDDNNLDGLELYMDEISAAMLAQASRGEVVTVDSESNRVFSLFKAGDQYILMVPSADSNMLEGLAVALAYITRVSTFLAAIFVFIALIVIIRPIKKVIGATVEVSKGDFDVYIPEKRTSGDIGLLIRNFNKMVKSLGKNEYLRKDFVSSVSHEFKTPITSIEGFAKLLNSGDLSQEDMKEYTEIIIKESARLSNMSANLLKLSELDSREFEPAQDAFFLDEQIRNIILLLENQWGKKNIIFEIDMDQIQIVSNEEMLFQVWYNLIHNAIKLSPEEGTIWITAKEKNRDVQVAIKDKGPGMTPEQVERIFERFYQADSSRGSSGSGLGLSIVKKIMDLLSGTIQCESTPGVGTIFTVTLKNLADQAF